MLDDITLGKRIRELREKCGKSQQELGKALGRSHAAVSDIERGKTKLTVADLSIIANFCGVTINDILKEPLSLSSSFTHFRDAKDITKEEKRVADKDTAGFLQHVQDLINKKQ
jgi:transcriptional regulator with XRE-family HTH domain